MLRYYWPYPEPRSPWHLWWDSCLQLLGPQNPMPLLSPPGGESGRLLSVSAGFRSAQLPAHAEVSSFQVEGECQPEMPMETPL